MTVPRGPVDARRPEAAGRDALGRRRQHRLSACHRVRVPNGEAERIAAAARDFGASASVGFGAVKDDLIRLDHTGPRAAPTAVLGNLVGYALGTGAVVDTTAIGYIVGATG